jgi:hypothetical protein
MILHAIWGSRGEFLNDLINVAGSDRVDLGVVNAKVVEEEVLLGVEEADEHLGNRFLVRVPDQVVEDPGVGVHVGKYLFCLCADEDCENLGEVTAEDRVELFFCLQEGQVSLKKLVLVSFNGYPHFWNSCWLSR